MSSFGFGRMLYKGLVHQVWSVSPRAWVPWCNYMDSVPKPTNSAFYPTDEPLTCIGCIVEYSRADVAMGEINHPKDKK